MPKQTTKGSLYFGDGAKVEIKASGDLSWTDLGVVMGAVNNTFEFDEVEIESANAGVLEKFINNMRVTGGFELGSLDPVGIDKLGGGALNLTTTTTTPTTTVDNQTISANWTDNTLIDLVLIDGGAHLVAGAQPTFTSVTASTSGVLAVDNDYHIVVNPNSESGYSIYFDVSGDATVATTESIVIDYNSVTPRATTKITMGTTSLVLSAYALRFTHTDSASKIRRVELYAVNTNSGGFQFNFKGANEDALETMPIAFKAILDTSRTDGDQLMAWTIEDGAQ